MRICYISLFIVLWNIYLLRCYFCSIFFLFFGRAFGCFCCAAMPPSLSLDHSQPLYLFYFAGFGRADCIFTHPPVYLFTTQPGGARNSDGWRDGLFVHRWLVVKQSNISCQSIRLLMWFFSPFSVLLLWMYKQRQQVCRGENKTNSICFQHCVQG